MKFKNLSVIFPENCALCEKSTITGIGICDKCQNKLIGIDKDYICQNCGSFLEEGECKICTDRHVYFSKNIPLFSYNDAMRKIIFYYKTAGKLELSKYFAKCAVLKLNKENIDYDFITFVPITKRKKFVREYNQSEKFAMEISNLNNKKIIDLLFDRGSFIQQKKTNYGGRFLNIIGRYGLKKKYFDTIKGKKILLVDDVFTTGATINECSRILKKYGAGKIFSLTISAASYM